MGIGIIVQTVMQTTAVLGAFLLGLLWHLEQGAIIPEGMNAFIYLFQHNWNGVDVQSAETMAFMTLSLCELFRAYTVRSERVSLFKLGFFSNKWMQYAVGVSIGLLLLVVCVPFLQVVFNTHFPTVREWFIVFGLALLPAIAEEITKFFLRREDARNKAAAPAD
jgi:Ca2+-transporting ATPase